MVRTSGTTKKSNTHGNEELNGTSVVTNNGADLTRPMVLQWCCTATSAREKRKQRQLLRRFDTSQSDEAEHGRGEGL
jgi:hypothetical protein